MMEQNIQVDPASGVPAMAPASSGTQSSAAQSTSKWSSTSKATSTSTPQQETRQAQPHKRQADPALLIGLAVSFARAGGLPAVPEPVLIPLVAAPTNGCGASQMVVEWLERGRSSKSGGGDEQA